MYLFRNFNRFVKVKVFVYLAIDIKEPFQRRQVVFFCQAFIDRDRFLDVPLKKRFCLLKLCGGIYELLQIGVSEFHIAIHLEVFRQNVSCQCRIGLCKIHLIHSFTQYAHGCLSGLV